MSLFNQKQCNSDAMNVATVYPVHESPDHESASDEDGGHSIKTRELSII